MLNMKYVKKAPILVVACVAVSACSLPSAKKPSNGSGGSGMTEMCPGDSAGTAGGGGTGGGASGGMGGSVATFPIDRVVTPMACSGDGVANPRAIDRYSQGYQRNQADVDRATATVSNMSTADLAAQMRGVYITPFTAKPSNIQHSEDTATIRGFRYRDASRGMNLGEDFLGAFPTAAKVGGANVGFSTAFPVSMARGAAFDLDLEYAVGEAIGDEMQAAKETLLLAPCMNLLRNPLWGRAQETYGEDPYQIGRLASAMVVGIQEHVLANAKHFMAYNVENSRDSNNSQFADDQALRETFGRHFRMVVQDAGVGSVMASYNLVNGTKSTQNHHTLTDVLRDDFGFQGFVLSDWWAMPNVDPKTADPNTLKRTAVEAVKAGLDVELPWGLNYGQLENLVATPGSGLMRDDLQRSAARVLEQKFRFNADPLTGNVGKGSPKTRYANSRIMCDGAHLALAEKAALESMVLLKNDNQTLPIKPGMKVAVMGAAVPYQVTDGAPGSGNTRMIDWATQDQHEIRTGDLGSSRVFPDPDKSVRPFEGIKQTAPNPDDVFNPKTVADAASADFIVVIAGLTPRDEGEVYTGAGDRASLDLDAKQTEAQYQGIQNKLIMDAAALGKPMVVVLEGGSVISMPWLSSVPAVVMAWYPGQRGGLAMGKLLWGTVGGQTYNFSGKLPLTWAKSLGDYGMFGSGSIMEDYFVGYRKFDKENITPLFPFGAGLSYTTFEYRKLQLGCSDMSKGAVLPVVVNVANTGTVAGDEIVMVFVSFPNTQARRPVKELKGFARVNLGPGEEKQISIPVRLSDLDYFQVDGADPTKGKWVVETGPVKIMVGGSSTNLPLSAMVNVAGYESASSK
jgi:beta-glucosidase